MHVQLTITGGIAPPLTGESASINTADLPQEEAREVQSLVARALQEEPPPLDPRARDAYAYELRIDTGDQVHSIQAFDGGIPPAIGELIQCVRRLAR